MPTAALHPKLLLVNPGAGSVTAEVEAKLRAAFSDHHYLHFPPGVEIRSLLSEQAVVVAAGGDGTIGAVARSLAGTGHSLGVLSLGTFNNFARGLNLPLHVDEAIQAILHGSAHPVTLGEVNGRAFVEGAAIGLFGEALSFGDAAKSHSYGEMRQRLSQVLRERPFEFRITGDIEMEGTALSLVAANTPTIGSLLDVGDKNPQEPYLELYAGGSRHRLAELGEMLASAVRHRHHDEVADPPTVVPLDLAGDRRFLNITIETDPPAHIFADLDLVGQTPAVVRAIPRGLNVILPV